MKINPFYLALIGAIVLAVVFGALIAVWQGFAVFTGVFLLVASGIFTYIKQVRYNEIKDSQANQRYCDAYLYADENGTSVDVANFKYPKAVERELKMTKRSAFVTVFTGWAMCIISLVIIVVAIVNFM